MLSSSSDEPSRLSFTITVNGDIDLDVSVDLTGFSPSVISFVWDMAARTDWSEMFADYLFLPLMPRARKEITDRAARTVLYYAHEGRRLEWGYGKPPTVAMYETELHNQEIKEILDNL